MNARERLTAAKDWLGWQDENLSAGLRTAFDALRLHDYAQLHDDLPDMADDWEPEQREVALGYDPLDRPAIEAQTSGADVIAHALVDAFRLLDSVAFVQQEGDTAQLIDTLSAVLPNIRTLHAADKRLSGSDGMRGPQR